MFSALQGLLAAKAGATYVSPFVGRLDAAGHDGMERIRQLRTIFDNYGFFLRTSLPPAYVAPNMCWKAPWQGQTQQPFHTRHLALLHNIHLRIPAWRNFLTTRKYALPEKGST